MRTLGRFHREAVTGSPNSLDELGIIETAVFYRAQSLAKSPYMYIDSPLIQIDISAPYLILNTVAAEYFFPVIRVDQSHL